MSANLIFRLGDARATRAAPINLRRIGSRAFAAALCVLATTSVSAQAPAGDSAQRVFEQERARCMRAPASEDRAACLQSAGAALEEAKRGRLDVASHPYEDNSTRRCEALPQSDRDDCVRRIHGEGVTSGSVKDGGIYREITTVQPGTATNR
jgi:hypothetical protein